jgi:hypothetical protein
MGTKKIPSEITLVDFNTIDGFLNSILTQANAMEVHLRINNSLNQRLAPLFLGWVEHPDFASQRIAQNLAAPGLFRFADDVLSTAYVDAFQESKDNHQAMLITKNWTGSADEKFGAEKSLCFKAGVKHQKCMAIVVDHNGTKTFVGTLNVGFAASPSPSNVDAAVNDVMVNWATLNTSPLVSWLDSNFKLSGPTI